MGSVEIEETGVVVVLHVVAVHKGLDAQVVWLTIADELDDGLARQAREIHRGAEGFAHQLAGRLGRPRVGLLQARRELERGHGVRRRLQGAVRRRAVVFFFERKRRALLLHPPSSASRPLTPRGALGARGRGDPRELDAALGVRESPSRPRTFGRISAVSTHNLY